MNINHKEKAELKIVITSNNELIEKPIKDFKEYVKEKYNDWYYVEDILIDIPYFIENMFFGYFTTSYDFENSVEEFKIMTALEATAKDVCILDILRERAIEIHECFDILILDSLDNDSKLHHCYHINESMNFINRLDKASQCLTNKEIYIYKYKNNNSSAKRISNMKSMINDFSNLDKQLLLEKFNHKCALTGREYNIEMDHVIPISWRIEGTTLSNMLPLEKTLNISKGNKNIFEWYEEKKDDLGINEDMFTDAITYIAKLNNMDFREYKKYVYDSHKSMLEVKLDKIKSELEKINNKISEMD